jgi:hypothetical protein
MLRPGEKTIFEAFTRTCPNFAGRKVKCEVGPDPPDYVCVDELGRRVGLELGEWLHEQQTRESKKQERLEESYCSVIKSEEENPPKNLGWVLLEAQPHLRLGEGDSEAFRAEIYQCVREVDDGWLDSPCREDPQGYLHTDFSKYPTLAKYLQGINFRPRRDAELVRGIGWISFPGRGGAYSPRDAVAALIELLRKKTNKYANVHREHSLAELYLVVYYDQALIHNTPYFGVGFGLDEVAKIASEQVAENPGPFQKLFLFNSTVPGEVVYQLWP